MQSKIHVGFNSVCLLKKIKYSKYRQWRENQLLDGEKHISNLRTITIMPHAQIMRTMLGELLFMQ